jgi:hypothetical protein
MLSDHLAPLRPDLAPGEVVAPRPTSPPSYKEGRGGRGDVKARSERHDLAPVLHLDEGRGS